LSSAVGATIRRATGTAYIGNDDTASAQPALSISSGAFYEGDSGKPKIPFTVSLNVPSASAVSAHWAATNVTTNAADVKVASGTVTIPAGALEAEVDVSTVADTVAEADETFQVTLSAPVGATIATPTGVETVRNDDPGTPANRAAIGDVSIVEGDNGTRSAQFVITLATPQAAAVSLHYATANGTATAGADYTARSGTVTIPAGAVVRVVSIPILGDTAVESNETFTLTLSSPSGTTITHAVGQGTIVDDD
jgi:chitinase